MDPSSYISHPTSAAGGHSRLGWLTRDQHSHSIEVIAFQNLVLGSTALHFLPSVSISAAPSLLLPASFGWACQCTTSLALAQIVAEQVMSWVTTAWYVEQVENALSGTMQCAMQFLTLQLLLALLP